MTTIRDLLESKDTEALCLQCGSYGRVCKCAGPYVEVPARPKKPRPLHTIRDLLGPSRPRSLEVQELIHREAEREVFFQAIPCAREAWNRAQEQLQRARQAEILARHYQELEEAGCSFDPSPSSMRPTSLFRKSPSLDYPQYTPERNNDVPRRRTFQEELERALTPVKGLSPRKDQE
jgi:hypothetical protein